MSNDTFRNVNASVSLNTKRIRLFADERPTLVKLFVNKPDMSFDDAEDMKATQVLKLTASDMVKDNVNELRFVKFQRVNSLAFFVEDNAGGEESVLSSLRVFGEPTEEMDIKAWQPIKG